MWEVHLAKYAGFHMFGLYLLFISPIRLGNLAKMWTWVLAGNLFSCLISTRVLASFTTKGKTDPTNWYCYSLEHKASTF